MPERSISSPMASCACWIGLAIVLSLREIISGGAGTTTVAATTWAAGSTLTSDAEDVTLE